ncbi:MAG: hypothetical protein PVF95_01575 [bacterium]
MVIPVRNRHWAPWMMTAAAVLLASALLAGCQKGESTSADESTQLLTEMKAWFEATDYEASGYASLEEALADIYQDDGYTTDLYHDIGEALTKSATGADRRRVLKDCQEWFELIDCEMSGYDTLEEAIQDIYQDDGETLKLYRRLVKYNGGSV